jgi:hypothetical protein
MDREKEEYTWRNSGGKSAKEAKWKIVKCCTKEDTTKELVQQCASYLYHIKYTIKEM